MSIQGVQQKLSAVLNVSAGNFEIADRGGKRVAKVVEEFCTFPAIEKAHVGRRALFCFLTGNEDMHLKNRSLITTGGRTVLTPAYDLLNSSVVLENPVEDAHRPVRDSFQKKRRSHFYSDGNESTARRRSVSPVGNSFPANQL